MKKSIIILLLMNLIIATYSQPKYVAKNDDNLSIDRVDFVDGMTKLSLSYTGGGKLDCIGDIYITGSQDNFNKCGPAHIDNNHYKLVKLENLNYCNDKKYKPLKKGETIKCAMYFQLLEAKTCHIDVYHNGELLVRGLEVYYNKDAVNQK